MWSKRSLYQCSAIQAHKLLPTMEVWYLTGRTNFTASLAIIYSYFANRVLFYYFINVSVWRNGSVRATKTRICAALWPWDHVAWDRIEKDYSSSILSCLHRLLVLCTGGIKHLGCPRVHLFVCESVCASVSSIFTLLFTHLVWPHRPEKNPPGRSRARWIIYLFKINDRRTRGPLILPEVHKIHRIHNTN